MKGWMDRWMDQVLCGAGVCVCVCEPRLWFWACGKESESRCPPLTAHAPRKTTSMPCTLATGSCRSAQTLPKPARMPGSASLGQALRWSARWEIRWRPGPLPLPQVRVVDRPLGAAWLERGCPRRGLAGFGRIPACYRGPTCLSPNRCPRGPWHRCPHHLPARGP